MNQPVYDFEEDIQRGILYFSMTDKEFLLEVINLIKPEYFEYPSHSKIFDVILSHFSKFKDTPPKPVLAEEVKKLLNKSEDFSDYTEEINHIYNMDSSSVTNSTYYMDLVEKFAKQSAMKEAITESIGLIQDGRVEEVEHKVKTALKVSREVDNGQIYFKDIQNRWIRELSSSDSEKFPTILDSCNNYLEGGNSRGELCIVVAPPGRGKSLYLVNQGVKALVSNKKVLYISLEMSEDKIAKRFDSVMTHIPYNTLSKPTSQTELALRHSKVKAKFPESELVIKEFPTGTANVNSIRHLMSQLELLENFVPDVILVDYLELLMPIRQTEQEHISQMRISEELRALGMESNTLMWTATQTNREGESVQLITKRELGGSYDKIKPADFALSLNQTAEEYDEGEMRGYVLKARDGKQFYVIPMSVDYRTLIMKQGYGNQEEEE